MSALLLRGLLERGHRALKSQTTSVHLYLGNEACDADSSVSALAYVLYATLLSSPPPPGTPGISPSPTPIPVISCTRSEFLLRREASVILQDWLGPSWSDTGIFLDDVLAAFPTSPPPGSRLTLLDHNRLKGELATRGWDASVASIVDHHFDEGAHPHVTGEHRGIDFDAQAMRGCGSACSLVANHFLTLNTASAADAVDSPLSKALLSVIALDTINLSSAKTTPVDTAAVEGLVAILNIGGGSGGKGEGSSTTIVQGLFSTLNALRSDRGWWLSLPIPDALGLDYKSFEGGSGTGSGGKAGGKVTMGTCALMVGALDYLQGVEGYASPGTAAAATASGPPPKPAALLRLEEACEFGRKRGCTLLLILSQVTHPSLEREVIFVDPWGGVGEGGQGGQGGQGGEGDLMKSIVEGLQGEGFDFDLREVQLPPSLEVVRGGMRAFKQGNTRHTRKTLLPAILKILG